MFSSSLYYIYQSKDDIKLENYVKVHNDCNDDYVGEDPDPDNPHVQFKVRSRRWSKKQLKRLKNMTMHFIGH